MKIIINADDFGMTKSVNEAIIELLSIGSISSTSVMVNMEYASEAKQLLDIDNIVGLEKFKIRYIGYPTVAIFDRIKGD